MEPVEPVVARIFVQSLWHGFLVRRTQPHLQSRTCIIAGTRRTRLTGPRLVGSKIPGWVVIDPPGPGPRVAGRGRIKVGRSAQGIPPLAAGRILSTDAKLRARFLGSWYCPLAVGVRFRSKERHCRVHRKLAEQQQRAHGVSGHATGADDSTLRRSGPTGSRRLLLNRSAPVSAPLLLGMRVVLRRGMARGHGQRAAHTVLSEKLLVRRRASPHSFLGWGLFCRQLCQHPGEASRRPPPFFSRQVLREKEKKHKHFQIWEKRQQIFVKYHQSNVRASTFA